jgi:predicted DNA-binding protein YlxM (UPF0122 family)
LGENIKNTVTQIEQFENQLNFMEKAAAKVEKVNSYVRDMAESANFENAERVYCKFYKC